MESTPAHSAREKFDFYFTGLIFTLLGLSVQTAKFGDSVPAAVLELVSWAALLIAGLLALWRLDWVPVALEIDQAAVQRPKGEEWRKKLDARVVEIHRFAQVTHRWTRWLFGIGLCSLLVARAWAPIGRILAGWR